MFIAHVLLNCVILYYNTSNTLILVTVTANGIECCCGNVGKMLVSFWSHCRTLFLLQPDLHSAPRELRGCKNTAGSIS